VPVFSNTYNERYTKEKKHTYIDKDETDSMKKNQTNEKNKLCAHSITRQARTTSSMQYYQW